MELKFSKIHAQGNDYIYFDLRKIGLLNLDFEKIAIELSKSHFGIGSDGIVLIIKSDIADAKMRIFNKDGSEANMCGSALRSIIAYLDNLNSREERKFIIDTNSGLKKGEVSGKFPIPNVRVNMGQPKLITTENSELLTINSFQGQRVDVGNPHFVCYVKDFFEDEFKSYGALMENNSAFSTDFQTGSNIEFVKKISNEEIKMYVWERGSGNTLACGTGSIAAVFSGIKRGLLSNLVSVHTSGGKVFVEKNENGDFFLEGEVNFVFEGFVNIDRFFSNNQN